MYVQGVLRVELENKADRQFAVRRDPQSSRRKILDREGRTLAESVQVSSCFVDPSLIENKTLLANNLSRALQVNEQQLLARLAKASGSFLWVKRNVPAVTVAELEKEKIPGVAFRLEKRRHYPMGEMASHLLGLVGYEGAGLSGIEQSFEKKLTGSSSGNVQLTIDAAVQQIAERELEWGARKTGAKKGLVVIQNPWNGEILATASWPPVSLDPDKPSASIELRIPTLVDAFEPGSTFKIVAAAAALEEKLVSNKEMFSGENGSWKVADITIHDHEPQQRMTFEDIFVHSSNIGTAKIAERIGTKRFYQYARLFGFGVFPGSGVSGEAKGVLRPPNKWSGVSKYVVSFGQEVGVTAIQLIGAYSAIANGGTLMEPRIVKAVLSDDGDVLWQGQQTAVRRVVSAQTAQRVTTILTHVVERGTGVNAQIQWDPSTRVAGKTGTAQKWDTVKHRYNDTLTLVSFCGFFPADHPQLTMLVILDEPQGRSWGGLDAAPIFRRIAEQLSPKLMAMDAGSLQDKPL